MALTHKIDAKIYQRALEQAEVSQAALARVLKIDDGTFSRWLKTGYPANQVRALARELKIKGDEFSMLIGAPILRSFFRKKYKGTPSETTTSRAKFLAKFWLNWEEFTTNSVGFPNLSEESLPEIVAQSIRGSLGLPEIGLTLESLCFTLKQRGIVVVPISFSYFGLKEEDDPKNNECAATIYDNVSKHVILLDTDADSALLIFNLYHELAHIFRLESKQGKEEENFCDNVASEMMYPDRILKDVLKSVEDRPPMTKLNVLHAKIGGSRLGITIALKNRKIISSGEVNRLWSMARSNEKKGSDFRPVDHNLNSVREFFSKIDESDPRSSPYLDLRLAALSDNVSGRVLSEYLSIESHDGIILVDDWKQQVNEVQL